MKTRVQTGDVIEIKKRMYVMANLQEKFCRLNRPTSTEMVTVMINVGDILTNDRINERDYEEEVKEKAKKLIQELLLQDEVIQQEEAENLIRMHLPTIHEFQQEQFDTSTFEGQYVVIRSFMSQEGGGHGEGYWNVETIVCKQLNNGAYNTEGVELTVQITERGFKENQAIQPVRQMTMHFY